MFWKCIQNHAAKLKVAIKVWSKTFAYLEFNGALGAKKCQVIWLFAGAVHDSGERQKIKNRAFLDYILSNIFSKKIWKDAEVQIENNVG